MDHIKVLLVEDKMLIAENISFLLRNHGMEVVGHCTTGEEVIQQVDQLNPDLVLMDVELEGAMDGISAAALIYQQHPVPVIFLSDFKDSKTVERAKKTFPVAYLSKPFNDEELVRAIDIACTNANAKLKEHKGGIAQSKHIFLRTDTQSFVRLEIDEILYLEADRAYCNIVTRTKEYKLSSNMNNVYGQLDPQRFIKVHRSFVVNINSVTHVDGNTIILGGRKIVMSKDYREELMGLLKIVK